MITKNINNGNLSANYDTAVATAPREWQAKIYKKSGNSWSEVSCAIKSITVTKGSCGSADSFTIGNMVASMLTAELFELTTALKGEDVRIDIGLYTTTWEWITLGHFTVTETKKTTSFTNITAYGFLSTKTGDPFVPPTLQTIGNIGSVITSTTGVPVQFDSTIDTSETITKPLENLNVYQALQIVSACCGGYVTDTYDGKFAVRTYSDTSTLAVDTSRMVSLPEIEEVPFEITGVLCNVSKEEQQQRQVSGQIVVAGGGTEIKDSLTWQMSPLPSGLQFTVSGKYTVGIDEYEYTQNFTYGTAYNALISSDDGDEGEEAYTLYLIYNGANGFYLRLTTVTYPVDIVAEANLLTYVETIPAVQYPTTPTGNENLVVTNEYMTASMYTHILRPNLVGYEYYPAKIDLSLGDPRLEGNDVLTVTDADGNSYIVPCHSVKHSYDGGLSSEITAVNATAQGDSVYSATPISTALNSLAQSLTQASTSANRAINYAESAKQSADTAKTASEQALASAQSASESASRAETSAGQALASARVANASANSALTSLSIVEDVAGILSWIQEHGTFEPTTDTTVQSGTVYFIYNTTTQDYEPIASPDPTKNPQQEGWYVLDISQSQSDYIMAHLAVTTRGLWVLPSGISQGYAPVVNPTGNPQAQGYYELSNDEYVLTTDTTVVEGKTYYEQVTEPQYSNGYKALLSNDGMYVFDPNGILVSTFGENITFSDTRQQYIGSGSAYVVFDPTANNGAGGVTIGGASIQLTGETLDSALGNKADITAIPTQVSQLTNDASYTTTGALSSGLNTLSSDLTGEINRVEGNLDEVAGVVENFGKGIIVEPNDPSVTLYAGSSQVQVTSESIVLQGSTGNTVTTIDSQSTKSREMYFTTMMPRADISGALTGKFVIEARQNGHLSLKKVSS